MQILKLEPCRTSRVKVYLEEDRPSFVLYEKEIRQYGLKEGGELSADVYDEILENVLIKRARNRALYLLARQGRTEWQLRKKLEEGFYPEEAVEAAISYAKKLHYLDDAYYAENFAEVRTRKKSRRMVEMELLSRGISRETAGAAIEGLETDEKDTIKRLVLQKFPEPGQADFLQAQKFLRSLIMKGFRYDDCRDVMNEECIKLDRD